MAKNALQTIIKDVLVDFFLDSDFKPDDSALTWYCDNDWFVTIIDFMPLSGRSEFAVTVAVNFLWTPVSSDYYASLDMGGRLHDGKKKPVTIKDIGDPEAVTQSVNSIAEQARKEANYYQPLRDWNNASRLILANTFTSDKLWGNWHRAMLCILTNQEVAFEYLEKMLEFRHEFNKELTEFAASQSRIFLSLSDDFPAARQLISETIMHNRQKFNTTYGSVLDLTSQGCTTSPEFVECGAVLDTNLGNAHSRKRRLRNLFLKKDKS
ncbi:MAG: hypothetical protein LBL92_02700 [Propionibacteriaceae bacterium]|jgi:hypothetical protein|nr:hypothetical protein [Propionibacteriaceae bacterium]